MTTGVPSGNNPSQYVPLPDDGARTELLSHSSLPPVVHPVQAVEPPPAIDQYKILEVLGSGSMGVVYRAVHATLHRPYAIKVMRPELLSETHRRRFAYEVEIHRQLNHPGISRLVHAGVTRFDPARPGVSGAPRPYFVMEYIDGQPLTHYARNHSLELRERLDLLVKVCDAVEYAHRRGVIHRDLKPANILVQADGTPKVLDFGLARLATLHSTLLGDESGEFLGTPRYASPEQAAGRNADLTPASDVYTLGLIAYELLTGQRPQQVGGKLQWASNESRLHDDAGLDSGEREFRYHLTDVLNTALRKVAGRRYHTAGELAADIEALLARFPTPSAKHGRSARLMGLFTRDPKPRSE